MAYSSTSRMSAFDVELLTCRNYKTWAIRMKFMLSLNKVWIDPEKELSTLDDLEKVKAENALGMMGMRCDNIHLNEILPFTATGNFGAAWKALAKLHSNPSLSNIVGITRKLFRMKFEGDDDMTIHVMEVKSLLFELEEMGEKFSEKMKTAILMALIKGYDPI